MKLSEREAKLLMRGLDKASSPAEAEKAAQALIKSLRERGIDGHEVTELFAKRNPSASPAPPPDPFSFPFPPSSAEDSKHCWNYHAKTNTWTKKAKPSRFDEWLESNSDQNYEGWCKSHPKNGYEDWLKRNPNGTYQDWLDDSAPKGQKASAGQVITIVSVMLMVGVVTHSLFVGVFVGFLLGIFWLALWSHRGFRKFVIWSLAALAIFVFLISKLWVNQSNVAAPQTPVTPRALYRLAPLPPVFSQFGDVEASKRPGSYGMRVATADEVRGYNEYINKGGDPNQVLVLDRLAVALAL